MRKSRLLRPISEPPLHLPTWQWPSDLNGRMETFRIGVDVKQELRQGSAGAVDHALGKTGVEKRRIIRLQPGSWHSRECEVEGG
jgi:hypothetical protein